VRAETVRLGRARGAVICVAALALCSPVAVGAEANDGGASTSADARARAQALLEQGNGLFRGGDVPEALRRYRDAYQAFPSAKLFFNIGACEEQLGQRASAMGDFLRFLVETAETGADPAVRAEAERRTRVLAAVLLAVDVVAPIHLVVQIDGAVAGLTPLRGPLWVEPGAHQVLIERAGQAPLTATVSGDAGGRVQAILRDPGQLPISDPVVPLPPRDPGAEKPPTGARGPWLWVGLGVLLIGGAVTTYLLLNRCPANQCQ
jgi:hypothetical protein